MDHLVSFGRSPPITVPYVCRRIFSGSILDYPERQGWQREALYRGDFTGHTPEEVQALLQEWLFFGPLVHFFDQPEMDFRVEDFVRTADNGTRCVTTAKLPEYAKRWYSRPNQPFQFRGGRTAEQQAVDFQHVKTGLQAVHGIAIRYCQKDANNGRLYPTPTFWPLTPEISLSILALCDSLTKLGFEATGMPLNLDWQNSELLYDRMITAGWCPNVLSNIMTAQQIGLMYSAESLGAPPVLKDHAQCSDVLCAKSYVDSSTYRTRHVSATCKCDSYGPCIDRVVQILGSGGVPVIQVHDRDGMVDVSVSETTETESSQYITISHVWSDGLGNAKQNKLPICQLRRLQALVNESEGTPASAPRQWWIDTLCVPVGEGLREYRNLAIRRLRVTYAKAVQTLVIDNQFQHTSIQASRLEIYLRLKLCNWMSRVWTLHEGVVSRVTVLQLADGVISLGQLGKEMMQTEFQTRRSLYTRYSFDSHTVLRPFQNLWQDEFAPARPYPQELKLKALWKQLQYRSTSKRGDEAVCLALMLGFSEAQVAEILQHDVEDWKGRIICFFRNIDVVNLSIFYQPPPRLTIPGFRWAPASFLSSFRQATTYPYHVMRKTGRIGPEGSGLLLSSGGLRIVESGSALPLIGADFHLQPLREGADLLRVSYIGTTSDEYSDRRATNIDGSRTVQRPAFVLAEELYSTVQHNAVLVDITESGGGEGRIVCNFIAWVALVRAADSNFPTAGLKSVTAELARGEWEWFVM